MKYSDALIRGIKLVQKTFDGVEISKATMLESSGVLGRCNYAQIEIEFKIINVVTYDSQYYHTTIEVRPDSIQYVGQVKAC